MEKKAILIPLLSVDHSVFLHNICIQQGVSLLGQLAMFDEATLRTWVFTPEPDPMFDPEDLQPVPMGDEGIAEIKTLLETYGLRIGMSFSKEEREAIQKGIE